MEKLGHRLILGRLDAIALRIDLTFQKRLLNWHTLIKKKSAHTNFRPAY